MIYQYDNSIIAIKNNHISQRNIGGPVTDLALKIMKDAEYKDLDYLCNYKGKSKHGKNLKSATYIIRDNNNKIIGLLCLNIDYSDYYSIKESIDKLLPENVYNKDILSIEDNRISENFNDSIEQLVRDSLKQININENIETNRLSQEEKIEIVKQLYSRGVFLLKGAVNEVTNQLQVSEATVYRYLNIIKREEKR
ncbi:PAS domain-containing protein [Abyssisolibacter fermentans]|uniref:PAS domain-containing protein n=1 Tax=Abyssisolibacter fermentans TaxID=1766203 RepID=UPI00082A6B72